MKYLLCITTSALVLVFSTPFPILLAQCTWTQTGSDIRFAVKFDERVGSSTALSDDGKTIVVSAPGGDVGGLRVGKVRVYMEDGSGNWVQKGLELTGGVHGDDFGWDVDINGNGDMIAVGAIQSSVLPAIPGFARVFKYNAGTNIWEIMGQTIIGEANSDRFGHSVSLSADGTILAVGAPNNNGAGSNAGHTRVFEFNGNTMMWDQKGQDIDGSLTTANNSGGSVSIAADGMTLSIGSNRNTKIFEWNAGTSMWDQKGSDITDDASQFYTSEVSINDLGNRVAVGNTNFNSFGGDVTVYQYDPMTSTWIAFGPSISGDATIRPIGDDLTLNSTGDILVTGAISTSNSKGSAIIYRLEPDSTWKELGSAILGVANGDQFGFATSISADGLRIGIGAPRNNNDATFAFAGQVQVFDIDSSQCGACTFMTDTTFSSLNIPCNSKLEAPKVLDLCTDSLLCGIALDSSFYFTQGTYNVPWQFTAANGAMDTVVQSITVDGVAVCNTASTGIGSLRNALNCAEDGDTLDILSNLMNDTLVLEDSGLIIDQDIILSVNPADNITIDASSVSSAFTINAGKMLSLDGLTILGGTAINGGVAINNGILNITNCTFEPLPFNGSQFSGSGEINIYPVTIFNK